MEASVQKMIVKQFYKSRIENRQNEYLHPSYQLEQKLLKAIEYGNLMEAASALKQINSLKRAKLADHHLRSLKNSLICSCTLFTRAIIRGGVHPEVAFNLSDVLIQEIERIHDEGKLEKFESDMILSFIQTLNSEHTPTYIGIVNKTIAYIHENILQELSLEKISVELYVNASYLSSIFKKETGITLTEFINNKRIEESKYFLLHSELSIASIASLFHFCNQSYYTYLFKKVTGFTPKQFRELEGEQEERFNLDIFS